MKKTNKGFKVVSEACAWSDDNVIDSQMQFAVNCPFLKEVKREVHISGRKTKINVLQPVSWRFFLSLSHKRRIVQHFRKP